MNQKANLNQKNPEFDVIVVGGGPGGSTCAQFLKKEGVDKVLLLEKARFPRDKTCGDAMSGKSVAVMRELGLLDKIRKLKHAAVTGVIFSAPNGEEVRIAFPRNKQEEAPGYVARRELYDNVLFQAAKEKVETIENFQVTDLLKDGDQVVGVKGMDLNTKEKKEFRSKIVVGADGASSIVANKVGLGEVDPSHQCISLRAYYENVSGCTDNIELHFVDEIIPGYFWIFPTGENETNIGIGMLTKDIRKQDVKLQEAMEKMIKNNPLFKKRFANAKRISDVKGWTLPLGSTHRKCAGNGFVLVGDAASLIDPFSGEGVGNATYSGRLAGKIIAKAIKKKDYSEEFLKQYDKQLHKDLDPELQTSYMLQRIGKIKFLLNLVITKAARNKEIAETISGMLGNEEAKKDFMSPLFYIKLLFA